MLPSRNTNYKVQLTKNVGKEEMFSVRAHQAASAPYAALFRVTGRYAHNYQWPIKA